MSARRTYPDPERLLAATCNACGRVVAGTRSGCKNFRYVLKQIKEHEDFQHPPYRKDEIIPALVTGVEQINGGNPAAQRVARYAVYPFAAEE